jgi:histidine triad (HIT) family protein
MADCLFCKIVAGEIPAEVIAEDEHCVAFRDINPQAPVHVLVVPRRHIASLNDLEESDAELAGRLLVAARRVAAAEALAERGYRLVVNCGREGCQSVDHVHVHLVGGRQLDWPPG